MDDLTQIIQEHNVKIFKQSDDIYEIIANTLEGNVSEEAFFIVDIGKVIRQYERWVKVLPNVKPYYAVKCNPNPVILKILSDLGCNFDCASKNEIASVLNDSDPSRIIFANPCKMSGQIKYARAVDVDTMTFDSDHELYKIKLYHPNARLILRIKVDDTGSRCRFGCKFGCPIDQVEGLLNIAKALSLNIVGVSFHVGSGCTDTSRYTQAIQDALNTIELAKSYGFSSVNIIDIGGGFDINTFDSIAECVNAYISKYPSIEWIAEPGRFMVNNSHTLVVNVIGKKSLDNEFVYYLNDGVYGSFNCIFFDHALPEVCPFNERNGPRYKSKIFGPTCDSIDKISDEVMLPELAIGEWCYIENFGAYTTAAASTFNGFQQTPVIYVLST